MKLYMIYLQSTKHILFLLVCLLEVVEIMINLLVLSTS